MWPWGTQSWQTPMRGACHPTIRLFMWAIFHRIMELLASAWNISFSACLNKCNSRLKYLHRVQCNHFLSGFGGQCRGWILAGHRHNLGLRFQSQWLELAPQLGIKLSWFGGSTSVMFPLGFFSKNGMSLWSLWSQGDYLKDPPRYHRWLL